MEYESDKLKQEMTKLRQLQAQKCCNLEPFIKDFISVLHKYRESEVVTTYFLAWMKRQLDAKSRLHLPGLRKNYHEVWTAFQTAKKELNEPKMNHLKAKVYASEQLLSGASLGLEHLFREVGQIYEAVKGSSHVGKDTKRTVEHLPEIAARLLIGGHPLELIDGDSSSVPITWITAVMDKLTERIGDKRLFILSVLGIQSSGKSTLLNTMFGLEFAVSAGRCTRGAYMQLLPVDQSTQLPFHYIVIIDTEGLRAPELGQQKHEHDNELATLVIGLGDVTMVNVKGENTGRNKGYPADCCPSISANEYCKQTHQGPSNMFVPSSKCPSSQC